MALRSLSGRLDGPVVGCLTAPIPANLVRLSKSCQQTVKAASVGGGGGDQPSGAGAGGGINPPGSHPLPSAVLLLILAFQAKFGVPLPGCPPLASRGESLGVAVV